MNLVYLKKVSVILVVLILCTPLSMMMNKNLFVRAGEYHEAQNVVGINASLMHSFCQNLSDIIYKKYDPLLEIPKGRWFGSKGEDAARAMIYQNFSNWGLSAYNDTINTTGSTYQRLDDINDDLEVNDISLTIYNITGAEQQISDFYIQPRWNKTWLELIQKSTRPLNLRPIIIPLQDRNELTHEFIEHGLHLYKRPDNITDAPNWIDFLIDCIEEYLITYGILDLYTFCDLVVQNFSDYHKFDWEKISTNHTNASELPWFNQSIWNSGFNFMFIGEDPSFNPDQENATPSWMNDIGDKLKENLSEKGLIYQNITQFFIKHVLPYIRQILHNIEQAFWNCMYLERCKGLILYENAYNGKNQTYNMNYGFYPQLLTIYVNRTIGLQLYNDSVVDDTDYLRVNYTLDQEWKPNVKSYNVIGEIDNPNTNKKAVIGCLYDGFWNAGSVDSAIGMSIVMAIANYTQTLDREYNIKPKYDLCFIAYGGEEAGLRGAYSYVEKHHDDDIELVIDLNQLGYNQTFPRQSLYCIYNTLIYDLFPNDLFSMDTLLKKTTEKTKYAQRTDQYTNLTVLKTEGIAAGDETWRPLSDYVAFDDKNKIKFGGELLDQTKTICIIKEHDKKPRSRWLQHHRTGQNYGKGDSMLLYNKTFVNITSELCWNLSRLFLYSPNCWFKPGSISRGFGDSNDDGWKDWVNISFEIDSIMPHDRVTVLARLWPPFGLPIDQQKQYCIGREGKQSYINLSTSNSNPLGVYAIKLYLFNSTGEIKNNTKNPDRKTRYLEKYANETWEECGITLFPYNAAPSVQYTPSSPTGINTNTGKQTSYTTGGTDPDTNQVYYQWRITNNATNISEYTSWFGPYNSSVNHTYNRTWSYSENNNYSLSVRMRDNTLTPQLFSDWSDPYYANVAPGVNFTAPKKMLVNQTLNVTGNDINFTGVNWSWTFDYSLDRKYDQNQNHTYTGINEYIITLTVKDSNNTEYSYSHPIEIVYVIANYSVNDSIIQSNQSITFNGSYQAELNNNTWYWDFGDGTNATTQNATHSYNTSGIYMVSLTVTDVQDRSDTYTQKIYVDSEKPQPISVVHTPQYLLVDNVSNCMNPAKYGINQNITIHADIHDTYTPIVDVSLNITYPDGTNSNLSMSNDVSKSSDFEYEFCNTSQIGHYTYRIWATDAAGNINSSSQTYFEIDHIFGYPQQGIYNITVEDSIKGTTFTISEDGTAEYISVHLQSNSTAPVKAQCMIYQNWDLIGTTEEKIISTGNYPEWIKFNLTGTKPALTNGTVYWLRCWSNDTCNISFNVASNESIIGYTYNETYDGSPPATITTIIVNPPPPDYYRNYSIFCGYSTKPIITDVTDTPGTVGFGHLVNISANVTDNSGLQNVGVTIEYPDDTKYENITMTNTENNTYLLPFFDTWQIGTYSYTIWATDIFGVTNNTIEYTFGVSSSATISIATIYDSYTNGSIINLTDPPPSGPCQVDHELIDNDTILHFWNKFDNYYINTTSGIQLTNHKDDYWTHNVLMLGYYQGGEWKKLYRTDELTNFTMDIDDTHTDYLNVTFWKNVVAKGYPLRLAIRYHLSYEDNELTVIPYIKSRAGTVPYQLGFGWELKDIQIDMTTSGDYIDVNQTTDYLNQTLNNTYTDLEETMFQIQEDITEDTIKSLYLRWNKNLSYKLRVKSRTGQYNAPVTLFIKVGTLAAGQEKSTKMYWYDASQVTYYFDDYDEEERWSTNPGNMVDGNTGNYAQTSELSEVQLCNDTTYTGIVGDGGTTITKVEIRGYGLDEKAERGIIYLRPIFGENDGDNHAMAVRTEPGWSPYFDITSDTNAPEEWSWTDIDSLKCDVEAYDGDTLNCSKIEVRVTYNNLPRIINPIPAHNTEGVSLTPTLNITVSDPNGDSMTLTWLSNSSGNWTTFGTNTSVSNGTYHQTFSNATVNGQWWYWKVQVNDGTGTKTSSIYKFYTGYQSKIKNTGAYDMRGYLLLEIEKYNSTSTKWEDVLNIFNDKGPRTLTTSGENSTIALDVMMNGLLNSSILWYYGNGTYRVYVALRDSDHNVLEVSGSTKLEATYEFALTFD